VRKLVCSLLVLVGTATVTHANQNQGVEDVRRPGPNPQGVIDVHVNLNLLKEFKDMADFFREFRESSVQAIYNTAHVVSIGGGVILGFLGAWIFGLSRQRTVVTAGLVLGALVLSPSAAWCQSPTPVEPMVDLVTLKYVDKNFGSRIDGAGMCVYNSFRGCMVSQYRGEVDDYARWLADRFPGGGYPTRVTEYTNAYTKAKNIQIDYVQVVGPESVQAIKTALLDGRAVAVTDSGDPSFYGGPVPHMTNIVYLDDEWAGIVDNNRPTFVEWVRASTWLKRHTHFDQGWCIIYLDRPQLVRPVNRKPAALGYFGLGVPLVLGQWGGSSGGGRLQGPAWCPPSGPSFFDSVPATQAPRLMGYRWEDRGGGLWYLYHNDSRIGEYDDKTSTYYEYRGDGMRSWRQEARPPADAPFASRPPQDKSDKPNGVDYRGFPEVRRGETLYGYGSVPLTDRAGRKLYEDKIKSDRSKARVVVNGVPEASIRQKLKALNSTAFIYGAEAQEVIDRMGYGKGVTVLGSPDRGVSPEVAYFANEPSEGELRSALIKADPNYRPGGDNPVVPGLGGIDGPTLGMAGLVAMLAFVFFRMNRG
jgi:hypothetical protein